MNMSGPAPSLSSLLCEMTLSSATLSAFVRCLKRTRSPLYIFFKSHPALSLKVGLRVFFLPCELLSKWMDRWSVIVILKRDLKGKWWMKKSPSELQKGTFIGT